MRDGLMNTMGLTGDVWVGIWIEVDAGYSRAPRWVKINLAKRINWQQFLQGEIIVLLSVHSFILSICYLSTFWEVAKFGCR